MSDARKKIKPADNAPYVRIQKTAKTSFSIEKLIYLQGKFTTKETWQLELK